MRRGFTFVEVLLALVLFMVGMLSALQVIPANRDQLTQSAERTQAIFLAQEAMETILGDFGHQDNFNTYKAEADASSATVAASGASAATWTQIQGQAYQQEDPFSRYKVERLVHYVNMSDLTAASTQGTNNPMRIHVRVTWLWRGQQQTFTLQSIHIYQ